MLKGCKQCVKLFEMGAVIGLQRVDLGYARGEGTLEVEGRKRDWYPK